MRIREVSWRRYHVPFVTRFRTAHGETTHRDGLIVAVSDDDGLTGLGDAAPLAEFGGGDVDHLVSLLRRLAPDLHGRSLNEFEDLLASRLPDRPDMSALRFALETALLDLQSKQQGVRLADLLAPGVRPVVPVNATIGQSANDGAVQAARDAVARGFQTVKLKVGIAESVAVEIDRIRAVREAIGPGILLRLDANAAWLPDQSILILNAVAPLDIELVEQPVAADDLDGLARVRRAVPMPIAADEALCDLDSARRIIAAEAADVLVIKPMVCGGLRAARRIIAEAGSGRDGCDRDVVVGIRHWCRRNAAPSCHATGRDTRLRPCDAAAVGRRSDQRATRGR